MRFLDWFGIAYGIFYFIIAEDSALNNLLDEPLKAGAYDAVTAGYFLLVNRFPRSRYRIEFGSEEPGDYSTRSVYDITVYPDRRKNPIDLSGASRHL